MIQQIIQQRRLQRAVWCKQRICPTTPDNLGLMWSELRHQLTEYPQSHEVAQIMKQIIRRMRNVFGYPNEDRLLWLELSMPEYINHVCKKKRAKVVYFVGCGASFLINAAEKALLLVDKLINAGVDLALLGNDEWCCGKVLKKLELYDELQEHKEHNLKTVESLGAKRVVFSCKMCYQMWRDEYQVKGIELELVQVST